MICTDGDSGSLSRWNRWRHDPSRTSSSNCRCRQISRARLPSSTRTPWLKVKLPHLSTVNCRQPRFVGSLVAAGGHCNEPTGRGKAVTVVSINPHNNPTVETSFGSSITASPHSSSGQPQAIRRRRRVRNHITHFPHHIRLRIHFFFVCAVSS